MTDIVKRLRKGVFGTDVCKTDSIINTYMIEADDEIEKLRESKKEIERDLAYKHAIISICSGYSEGMDIAERILATVDIKLTEDMIKRMRG